MASDGRKRVAALLDPSELLQSERSLAIPAETTKTDPQAPSSLDSTKSPPQFEVTKDAPLGHALGRAESMADFPPEPTHATWVRGPPAWGIGVPSSSATRPGITPTSPEEVPVPKEPGTLRAIEPARAPARASRAAWAFLITAGTMLSVALVVRFRALPPTDLPVRAPEASAAPLDVADEKFVGRQTKSPKLDDGPSELELEKPPEYTPATLDLAKKKPPRGQKRAREREEVRPKKSAPRARARDPHPHLSSALARRRLSFVDLRLLLPDASFELDQSRELEEEADRALATRISNAPITRALAEAHLARALEALRRAALDASRLESFEARYFGLARRLPSAKDGPEAEAVLREADALATELR
ncbi:MAG: hypothetical protein HY791_00200 [Deltaproteobacteria bacterium]|nr:hypothetical protein [Deltaproteobacteria bacterium]